MQFQTKTITHHKRESKPVHAHHMERNGEGSSGHAPMAFSMSSGRLTAQGALQFSFGHQHLRWTPAGS